MKEVEYFVGPPPPDDKLPKKKPNGPTPKIEVASKLPPIADPDDPGELISNMLGMLDGVEVEDGAMDQFLHNTTVEARRIERKALQAERRAKRGKKGKRRR